jgi:polyisoprenoid-binding protein YceI
MKRTRSSIPAILFCCICALAIPARAENLVLQFDPGQTQIHWSVRENLRVIHGTFALNRGEVALNTATGSAQGELLVDTDSIQSGNQSRDAHLKTEVLETTKYPQAFFHATQISGAFHEGANDQITVGGLFNIHGTDHPFTIPVSVQRTGNSANVTAHFKVPYVDWGMKRTGSFLWKYGKEVEIEMSSHATIQEVPEHGL